MGSACLSIDAEQTINPQSLKRSYRQLLEAKSVIVTHDSLIAALHSNDPEVRGYAAFEIANERDAQAAKSLEIAVATETDPQVQVEMARALTTFSSPTSKAYLVRGCSQVALPRSTLNATESLLPLDKEAAAQSCTDSLLSLATGAGEQSSRVNALHQLQQVFPNLSGDRQVTVSRQVSKVLDDQSPRVKLAAIRLLASTGNAGDRKLLMQRAATDPQIFDLAPELARQQ